MTKQAMVTKFVVEGCDPFPLDMLRYDACFPFDQQSVGVIERSYDARERIAARKSGKPLRVTLMALSRTGMSLPTQERWRSFGWSVDPTSLSGGTL